MKHEMIALKQAYDLMMSIGGVHVRNGAEPSLSGS